MYAANYTYIIRRAAVFFALCFFSITLSACDPDWPKCDSDAHCAANKKDNPTKKKMFCVNNKCQQCKEPSHCGDAKFWKCEENTCRKKTCADVTCPAKKECRNDDTLECVWICENDGDKNCKGDPCKICKDHQCVAKPAKCNKDLDCPGKLTVCSSPGKCEAACVPGCSPDKPNPCPAGQKCNAGKCEQASCNMSTVYFDLNKANIRSSERDKIRANAECAKKMTGKKVLFTGHADERGTVEFNIHLSKRRAKSASSYLKNLGLSSSRVCIVPKGKSDPARPNASTESEHQENRRVVFTFVDSCP